MNSTFHAKENVISHEKDMNKILLSRYDCSLILEYTRIGPTTCWNGMET